ncbi:hypothetical protein PR202_ga27499 [Eleusine coracana subsp. coracana]|uniref:F-box domain-containing protein n=1 Tax=Eleusine coracana subsp. coracana TaxID=191504 RepID=A0AAV5DGU5_ELECO|nr:hypothetical protein QOZ80_8AG0620730 [Eleusine coracana subsp. coracana]GJN09487.1 hypothetical protein PR202_ga27499 [Eleusine coracana subsp. coracana]
MPPKATTRWVPVNQAAGGASRGRGGSDPDPKADRLSALPDSLLHHILSFLKAWEMVQTCVLSRRWRHLWASVPCIDLRVGQNDCGMIPEDFPGFVRQLACRRDASASLDTIRLRSNNVDDAYDEEDSKLWIRAAIRHAGAQGILTMFKCQISANLSIAAPNLVLLRCILPITQAPSFKNMTSVVSATIMLDDYSFSDDFEDFSKDEFDETTDDDDDDDRKDNKKKNKSRYGFGDTVFEGWLSHDDGYDYGSDINSDDDTYEYSEIASDCGQYGFSGGDHYSCKDGNHNVYSENSGRSYSKIIGGHNVLQSLSNATSLELIADAGEVILNRELKRCPNFGNLKTMSLGEWYLRSQKMTRELGRQELEFWGNDEFWGDDMFFGDAGFSDDDDDEFGGDGMFCGNVGFSDDDEFW